MEKKRIDEKQIVYIVLVLAGLAFATYVVAQTFNAPTVDEGVSELEILETGAGAGGEAAVIPAVIETNESEEIEIEDRSGIPEWWHWSKEDWEKFQWYANETEVIWTYNETTGEKVSGKVMVAGEPLFKEFGSEPDKYKIAPGYKDGPSPVWYLETKRKGNCAIVSKICYLLFRTKGETVKLANGKNIDNGKGHGWVEWTDNNGQEWAINYNLVRTVEQQHAKYKLNCLYVLK